jgi:hypothetical protein
MGKFIHGDGDLFDSEADLNHYREVFEATQEPGVNDLRTIRASCVKPEGVQQWRPVEHQKPVDEIHEPTRFYSLATFPIVHPVRLFIFELSVVDLETWHGAPQARPASRQHARLHGLPSREERHECVEEGIRQRA